MRLPIGGHLRRTGVPGSPGATQVSVIGLVGLAAVTGIGLLVGLVLLITAAALA